MINLEHYVSLQKHRHYIQAGRLQEAKACFNEASSKSSTSSSFNVVATFIEVICSFARNSAYRLVFLLWISLFKSPAGFCNKGLNNEQAYMTTSAERLCRIRFTNLLPLYIETSWVPVRCLKAGWRPSGHMLFFPVLPLPLTLPFYILYYPFNPPILPLLTPNFAPFNPPILPPFTGRKGKEHA